MIMTSYVINNHARSELMLNEYDKKLAKCESYSRTKGSVPVVFVVIAATIIHHP